MWYNPIVAWLLRSPLHGLASGNMMLLSYHGRRSGKRYTLPVSYLRDGDTLHTVSYRSRRWWRNLSGGAPVTVRLQGKNRKGTGLVIAGEDEAVAARLSGYLKMAPGLARYFDVGLDASGRPRQEDVERAARDRVMVEIRLA